MLHWGSHQKKEEGGTNQKKKRRIAAFAAGTGGIGAGNSRIGETDCHLAGRISRAARI